MNVILVLLGSIIMGLFSQPLPPVVEQAKFSIFHVRKAPVAAPPVNTALPAITAVNPVVGTAEVLATGTWKNSPTSYACQWNWGDTGAPIAGATSCSTYMPIAADVGHTLTNTVTAGNASGFASATALPTGVVASNSGNYAAWPSTGLTNGQQLTTSMVGVTPLSVTEASLLSVNPQTPTQYRINSDPFNTHPWDAGGFVPNAPYVFNNDPANHGGYVPAGGMYIDGFFIPEGVWVIQYIAFLDSIIVNGDNGGSLAPFPGVVFRGCSFRGPATAPGPVNLYQTPPSNTNLWFFYNSFGGNNATLAQLNEVALKLNDSTSNSIIFRNLISYTDSGIQPDTNSVAVIENLIYHIQIWNPSAGYHLNGVSFAGGEANALVLRNNITLANPDDNGYTVSQTDAIAFFHDFAGYTGTGTNIDGTTSYQIRDNYIGGGSYTLYAGTGGALGNTVPSNNFTITGNKFTTQWYSGSGSAGPVSWPPSNYSGYTCSNNTYADGPNAGTSVGTGAGC